MKFVHERIYLLERQTYPTLDAMKYEAAQRYKRDVGNYPTHMALSEYHKVLSHQQDTPPTIFRMPIVKERVNPSYAAINVRPVYTPPEFHTIFLSYGRDIFTNEVACVTLIHEEEEEPAKKKEEEPTPMPTPPPVKQEESPILDMFGDPITPGVVLACGHRLMDVGALTFGIVTGFTEQSILVKQLQRGSAWYSKTGKRYWSRNDTHGEHWQFVKGHYPKDASHRYYITGMTEQDLIAKLQDTAEQIWLVKP